MERGRSSPEPSRIPVLRSPGESAVWTTLENKLKQLDEMAAPSPYIRLLAGCCRDSVQAARQMHSQLEAARGELQGLRLQLRKSTDRVIQLEQDQEDLRSRLERADAESHKAAEARQQMALEQSRMRAQFERMSSELANSMRQQRESLETRIHDALQGLAKQQEASLEARLDAALGDRLAPLHNTQRAAESRQRLLDEAEPWTPLLQCTFQELPLIRNSRDAPYRWALTGYQRLKEESRRNGQPRLYSRPFGIEREGSVRCVLRLVACLGVPAGQEGGDAVQFGLELLHSAKCAKKFDFFMRLLDRSGNERHLVKSFSSSELAVPRYFFSRPALGMVSFAVLVSEQRMLREGLLCKDVLAIEVGLQ